MNILITGATGLVGTALVTALTQQHTLILAGRSIKKLSRTFGNRYTFASTQSLLNNAASILQDVDCVINLAGENIGAKRWSRKQLHKITDSRVDITSAIAHAAASIAPTHSLRLINASAIGIYGLKNTIEEQTSTTFDESSPIPSHPTDELAKIGCAWEAALQPAIDAGVSVTKLRFGVILAKQGGALAKLLPSFSFGLGAMIGSGKQPFSWVTLHDIIRSIEFIINHPNLSGTFNVVAPNPTDQATFARTLAKTLKKPCFLSMPGFAVTILFGKMGKELLMNGHKVLPTALTHAGFKFLHPEINEALKSILNQH